MGFPFNVPRRGYSDKPERAASILILGKPGSGKTTVLRDICRKVSQEQVKVSRGPKGALCRATGFDTHPGYELSWETSGGAAAKGLGPRLVACGEAAH